MAKAAHGYRYLIGMARLQSEVQNSTPTGEKITDPMLGVDYRVTTLADGSFRVFFSETGGTQALGEARILTVDDEPYPVTTRQTINATFGETSITGGFDFTTQDEDARSSALTGGYDLTTPKARVFFDLATTNGVESGTFGARVADDDVVDCRNVTTTATFATQATFTVHGREGTVTMNADGSGQALSTDGSGTYTLRWTTDWNVTLVRPDGSSTVLGSIDSL